MSETGATAQQVEAALDRIITRHWNDPYLDTMVRERHRADVERLARFLVPPGYQIVPKGAVTLSAEDAELGADGLSRLIARYESLANEHDRSGRTEQWLWERNNAAKYRALAAKLSGGAS